MKIKLIQALAAIIALSVLAPAQAADKPKAKSEEKPAAKAEAKPKEATYPLYGKVVAITSRTLTIVRGESEEAKESKYSIGASTEVVNGEKPATLEDVKIGSWVGGSVKKSEGGGNDFVSKINLGVKQKGAAGKGAKAAAKKETSKAKKKED